MYYLDKNKEKAIEIAVKNKVPVLLIGETGIGKTTIVKHLAKKSDNRLVRVSINDQVGREDLIGKYGLVDGNTVWTDGPLLAAMRNGEWIVLDEINSARPEVLFALHSVLDDERSILLNEKDNEIVKGKKNFKVFCTMNPPSYNGVKNLNQALLSRFTIVNITVAEPAEEVKIIKDQSKVDDAVVNKLVSLAEELRTKKKEGQIDYFCSTRDLIQTAQAVENGLRLEYAVLFNILNKMTAEDYDFVTEGVASITDLVKLVTATDWAQKIKEFEQKEVDARNAEIRATQLLEQCKKVEAELVELDKVKVKKTKENIDLNAKIIKSRTELTELAKLNETERKIIAQEYLKKLI